MREERLDNYRVWHTCHLVRCLTAPCLIRGTWAKADMRDQPEMSFLPFGKMPETPAQSHLLPKTPSGDSPGLAGESGARPARLRRPPPAWPGGLPRVPRPCHSPFWVLVHGLPANGPIPATTVDPRQPSCRPDHLSSSSRPVTGQLSPHCSGLSSRWATPRFSPCSRHGPWTRARDW